MAIAHPAKASSQPALSRLAATVPDGTFAFVMATGIVSIAAAAQGLQPVAQLLFVVNVAAFAMLSALTLLRLLRCPAGLFAELAQHRTAPGFLTIVAAVAVLGDQFALETGQGRVAAGLWLAGCVLWLGLVYALFLLLTTRSRKPSLRAGLGGAWLLLVVATEALSVLGTHVADAFARPAIIAYLSLCWFLLGGFFYLLIIVMIVYRWWFVPLPPEELTPPYWINMGAMAIATLAGARLQIVAATDPLLTRLSPAIAAMTVLFWIVATWWIPLLALLTTWRHAVRRVRPAWGADLWSMVFPLGMYTAATWNFARAERIGFLDWIPRVFVWVALAAWLLSFAGMLRRALGRAS
jgi:tellurite resistance protein TehA-like permease